MSIGLIAEKIGMITCFSDEGVNVPITVLKMDDNIVFDVKNNHENQNEIVVSIASGITKEHKLKKPLLGMFKKKNLQLRKRIRTYKEMKSEVDKIDNLKEGQTITADFFDKNIKVDVQGITVGKGFAGVIKRHNFAGLCATHGVSVSHRSHGSTGHRTQPGRVFKGKKMAGHMGAKTCTIQGLKIFDVDIENNLLLVKGSIPGKKGGLVVVKKSTKNTKN